jgi:hypothetical protein
MKKYEVFLNFDSSFIGYEHFAREHYCLHMDESGG